MALLEMLELSALVEFAVELDEKDGLGSPMVSAQ
jgi:hypothetical protein